MSTTTNTIENLPAPGGTKDLFLPTDSLYDFIFDAADKAWAYFYRGAKVTPPSPSGWSWINQGSAVANQQTNGVLAISSPSNGATDSIHAYGQSAPATPWKKTIRWQANQPLQNYYTAALFLSLIHISEPTRP